MIVVIEKHLAEMRQHGERDYPFECCGFLLGRFHDNGQRTVVATYAISNAREEAAKRDRFLIRPEEHMRGEKYARSQGLDIIGCYHSHPDDRAVPSQYDLDHAWPTYSYIVMAVEQGQAADLRSWQMKPDRSEFEEEELAIADF